MELWTVNIYNSAVFLLDTVAKLNYASDEKDRTILKLTVNCWLNSFVFEHKGQAIIKVQ